MSAFDSLVNVLAALRDKPMAKSLEMPWPPGTNFMTAESLMRRAEPAGSALTTDQKIQAIDDTMEKALRLHREGKITMHDVVRLEGVANPLRAALS